MKTALTIAGTDPSGGAGLHADLKAFTAHGVYGMGVITALVAQNTRGVILVERASPAMLEAQLEAVLCDIPPDAVKIGMVPDALSIGIVARALRLRPPPALVIDPVMVSTSGHRLLGEDALEALIRELFPLATLITPNIPEAEALCGFRIDGKEGMLRAAKEISKLCLGAVLLKGGHLRDSADDLLFSGDRAEWLEGKRIDTPNTHGTGCTLSAAIAANLASGLELPESVRRAKRYLTGALSQALSLGHGNGPVDHCWGIAPGRFRPEVF